MERHVITASSPAFLTASGSLNELAPASHIGVHTLPGDTLKYKY
jgi:hypothetical protein